MIAIVGMPGSGKSIAVSYIEKKGIPFIRFGDITDEGLKKESLEINPQNEKIFREKLRAEKGMAAYAIESKAKIDDLFMRNKTIAIDGLYSWEEYVYLKNLYPSLVLIALVSDSEIRYKRLSERKVRPLTLEEAKNRDEAEIEKLNKGGPIAFANYFIENNGDDINALYKKIDEVLVKLNI